MLQLTASDDDRPGGVIKPFCLCIMGSDHDRVERAQRDPSGEELAAHDDETATTQRKKY